CCDGIALVKKTTDTFLSLFASLHELFGSPEAILLPLLRYSPGSQPLRHCKFMKVNGPACNFVDDFRSRHGTVEQIFAGLKLISGAAVEDVPKRRITIGNDFFPREESNDTTRAEAVRNLDKTTLGRVSNNTPLSARVERKSPHGYH